MPSYSAYSSPPSSNQNPSFYRITRYFLFFFFLVDPSCVYKETEGDIQRNTSSKALFFRRDTFEKRVHKHLPGETNPVSSMRRRGVYAQRSIAIRGRSF